MIRSIRDRVLVSPSLHPQTITADVNGTGVDVGRDYDSAMFVAQAGAISGAGLVIPVAQESDDDSVYTDVAAGDLDGAFVNLVTNTIQKVGYKGAKRFLRIKADYLSGTNVLMAGFIEAGHAHRMPVA
jgi:hypothetical protein